MIALCPPRLITLPERTSMTRRTRRADLIENIEHMLTFKTGEAEIFTRSGAKTPEALKARLRRAGRADLIPRIFEWDATYNDRALGAPRKGKRQ